MTNKNLHTRVFKDTIGNYEITSATCDPDLKLTDEQKDHLKDLLDKTIEEIQKKEKIN